jgi:hypothetical protein
MITDVVTTLCDDRGRGVLIATVAVLHATLPDFALRAANRRSDKTKPIPRAMAAADPELAARFEAAFATLFASGDASLVEALVDVVLAALWRTPAGGLPPSRAGRLAGLIFGRLPQLPTAHCW